MEPLPCSPASHRGQAQEIVRVAECDVEKLIPKGQLVTITNDDDEYRYPLEADRSAVREK